MKQLNLILFFCIFCSSITLAQNDKLTGNIIYPRLEKEFWDDDFKKLNSNYSNKANSRQTCFWQHSDSLVKKSCINSTISHIKLDSALQIKSASDLIGKWTVIDVGVIAIVDSFNKAETIGHRTIRVIDHPQNFKGEILFTKSKMTFKFSNNGKKTSEAGQYKLIDNKYIVDKGLLILCCPKYVGITKTGFLIIDQVSTTENNYKIQNSFSYRTLISRTVLSRTE